MWGRLPGGRFRRLAGQRVDGPAQAPDHGKRQLVDRDAALVEFEWVGGHTTARSRPDPDSRERSSLITTLNRGRPYAPSSFRGACITAPPSADGRQPACSRASRRCCTGRAATTRGATARPYANSDSGAMSIASSTCAMPRCIMSSTCASHWPKLSGALSLSWARLLSWVPRGCPKRSARQYHLVKDLAYHSSTRSAGSDSAICRQNDRAPLIAALAGVGCSSTLPAGLQRFLSLSWCQAHARGCG